MRRRTITTVPTIAPLAANIRPKSQVAEPSAAASAPAGTALGTGNAKGGSEGGRNKSTGQRCHVAWCIVDIFPHHFAVRLYLIPIGGHEEHRFEDASPLVVAVLAAPVFDRPVACRVHITVLEAMDEVRGRGALEGLGQAEDCEDH